MDSLISYLFNVSEARALDFLALFSLILARTTGFLANAPPFSGKMIPPIAKGAWLITFTAFMTLYTPIPDYPDHPALFILLVASEVLLGVFFSVILNVPFGVIRMAGQITGIEIGLSFSAIADPLSGASTNAVSSLYSHMATQLFIIFGFDYLLLRTLWISNLGLLPGSFFTLNYDLEPFLVLTQTIFINGVHLAIPITGLIFGLKLMIALLAKFAPQLQIFSLAFPLTLLLGFILLPRTIPDLLSPIHDIFSQSFELMYYLIKH